MAKAAILLFMFVYFCVVFGCSGSWSLCVEYFAVVHRPPSGDVLAPVAVHRTQLPATFRALVPLLGLEPRPVTWQVDSQPLD